MDCGGTSIIGIGQRHASQPCHAYPVSLQGCFLLAVGSGFTWQRAARQISHLCPYTAGAATRSGRMIRLQRRSAAASVYPARRGAPSHGTRGLRSVSDPWSGPCTRTGRTARFGGGSSVNTARRSTIKRQASSICLNKCTD